MYKINYLPSQSSKSDDSSMIYINDARITILTDSLFRIEVNKDKIFEDKATQSVLYRNLDKVDYKVKADKRYLFVETNKVILKFDKKTLKAKTITFKDSMKVSKCNNANNLKSTKRTLDQTWGKVKLDNGIISLDGVAIYDDGLSLIIEENGDIHQRNHQESDLYIFAYGKEYRRCLNDFYKITGKTPLIPRFALGVWWSRYRAYTQDEYMSLITSFKEHNIPLSVATIDMDWHWVDIKGLLKDNYDASKMNQRKSIFYSDGWTGYSWNTNLFYDYKAFLKWLHEQNLKVTVNLHPSEGVRYYEDQYLDMAKKVGIDPSSKEPIKFSLANKDFIEGYFKILHHPYEKDGVDFWWIDWQQGTKSDVEGLDPLWALNHYHYLDNDINHENGLILSRYAGVGSHRYPLGFSGDTHIRWSALKFQPYFTINANNIGYTWWSHDIGGHMLGYKDDELYLRWLQFGVFSPIMRLHSSSNDLSGKEPYRYPSHIKDISIRWLQLRSKLVPYIYSLNYLTHTKSLPLCEAMYYRYDNQNAYKFKNQYMFGDLLVAPITSKTSKALNMSKVKLWLPEGDWTDIFTNKKYKGNQVLTMYRDLSSIPVLAKQGSIIPLKQEIENGTDLPKDMEILIYNGNGKFTMFEDDGLKLNKAIYLKTIFEISKEKDHISFKIGKYGDQNIRMFLRNYKLSFKNIKHCEKVEIYRNNNLLEEKEFKENKLSNKNFELTIKEQGILDTFKIKLYGVKEFDYIDYKQHIVDIMSKWQKGAITKAIKYNKIKKHLNDKEKCHLVIKKTSLNKVVKKALLEAFDN